MHVKWSSHDVRIVCHLKKKESLYLLKSLRILEKSFSKEMLKRYIVDHVVD